ncbi:MAG TPA: hypothetical protein VF503_04520 [Sphingobium sp.]|uniref:hypothetical protein n=1 Tax=Sphingobium sp. TaxID=1912891 RepID=UPI002ED037D7
MDALLLALLLNLSLDQGAGTQRVVARFSDCGETPGRIVSGLALVIAINAVTGAALGAIVAALLMPDARLLFLSMALALGGIGLMMTALRSAPTAKKMRATGIPALFHFALRRAGENGAFATAGVAAFTDAPILTASGAMLGGWVALILPLSLGSHCLSHGVMRAFQIIAGLILLCAGIACAASALHLL